MGIRDVAWLNGLAGAAGMVLLEDIEMPVNNRTLVWRKRT
jgi:predicted transcriptional regulator